MRPDQVVRALQQIATGIDNSRFPQRELVAKDIRRVLTAIDADEIAKKLGETLKADELEEVIKSLKDVIKDKPKRGETPGSGGGGTSKRELEDVHERMLRGEF